MTQKARPFTDVSTGNWTPTPIYRQIYETWADDSTYVTSGPDPVGDTFEVQLAQLGWPQPGQQTLTVRLRKTDSPSLGATIKLLQGSTVIQGMNVQPTQTFADYTLTLSDTERQRIIDYTDLRVRVTAGYALQVGCCPGRLPDLLKGVISNKTGFATQLPDVITLVWDGLQWFWDGGTGIPCSGGRDANLSVRCAGSSASNMILSSGAAILAPASTGPSSGASCSPLAVTFAVNFTSGICGPGSYTLTVTE